uniref:Exosome complex component 10 homolog n=2 Tax=Parascaris univalens TaxID=6257 RepID=A0A915BD32_PARUN
MDKAQEKEAGDEAPDSNAINECVKKVQHNIVQAVRAANFLPKRSEGYELFASFPLYAQFMNEQETRILTLLRSLMRSAGCRIRLPSKVDDVDDLIDIIAEGNDAIVERFGILMDALSRSARCEDVVIPQMEPGAEYVSGVEQASQGRYAVLLSRFNATGETSSPSTIPHRITVNSASSKVLVKPQVAYGIPVDNTEADFVPRLKEKHNAVSEPSRRLHIRDEDCDNDNAWFSDQQESAHPYQLELETFKVPSSQLELGDVRQLRPIKDTELVMVDDAEKLKMLRDELNGVSKFAVDLEHHSYRSFLGLTCLMQISTAEKDYIVDPFPIWNDMQILNEPFTNPNILKVFHGSEYDVQWLQRDFGIYVVGMFDTFCAMHVLNFAKYSLAHLVQSICNVTLDKELQKADWRVRPLTAAHIEYARSDTHYLLYCYDTLRQRLINEGNESNNLLRSTFNESALICRTVYKKPKFESEGYETLLRGRKSLNSRQLYALKALWKWRDDHARAEDESLEYVLPNHMLLQIAEVLPREAQGILACCSPVPPLVKQELMNLHRIVHTARDRPLELRPTLNLNQATLTFEAYETQRSKMTKWKALLRSHMDFSMTKFDEEISTSTEMNDAESVLVPVKKNAELTLTDRELPNSVLSCPLTDPLENSEEEGRYTVHTVGAELKYHGEKCAEVKETLSQWATPYECYVIALKERQTKEAEERAKEGEQTSSKDSEGKSSEKKLWSHHDPASIRITDIEEELQEKISEVEIKEERRDDAEAAVELDEEMTLTKKALKRKRKLECGKPDIERVGIEGGRSGTAGVGKKGAAPKKKWTGANELDSATVVDYTKFDSQMFNEKPQPSGAYDPFGGTSGQQRGRSQRGGRRRGGAWGRPQSHHFGSRRNK